MKSSIQSKLRPLSVGEPATMARVLGSEAEWRDALQADPALLESVLGAPVESVETEPQVGPYAADLAVSTGGLEALVEIQMGPSDARHLGQVLRYALHGSADLVIWLCDEVAEGDARAVAYLNKVLATKVLPVTVHTIRIPTTGEYLQFPRVVEGHEYAMGRGLEVGPATARELAYQRFWRVFVARTNVSGVSIFSSHNPGRQKWIRASLKSGTGLYLRVALASSSVRVGVQVDTGNDELNASLWDELLVRRDVIEDAVEAELEWRAPGRTGVIEARVEGGYSLRPEVGAANAVSVLAQIQKVMAEVLDELPLHVLQPTNRFQATLY